MEVKDKKIYDYIYNNELQIEEVFKDYKNYVYTIIKRACSNLSKEDIDEVNLDVFLTLWKNQNKLNINNNMSSYIAGIAKNLIKQKYRNIRTSDNILDYEEHLISSLNIELIHSKDEQNAIIVNELKRMKIEKQNIFLLYYYENKTIKEISKLSNVSESKVKTELFRIRKKLETALKKKGYDFYE